MQRKDFGAQNLGFSCREKILMHRISDFGVEKRFWCTESRIFMQKKDFDAQNLGFWSRKKIFMHKMPQFEEEMKTERTILSGKRAHRDFDTPFIARFMFLWVQKSLI